MENKSGRATPLERKNKRKSGAIIVLVVLLILSVLTCAGVFYFMNQAKNDLQTSLTSKETELAVANAEIASMEEELSDYRKGPTYTQSEMEILLEKATASRSEEIRGEMKRQMKEAMLSGEGTVPMLRGFFPEEIVFLQSGSYYFIPIDEAVKPRQWKNENLVIDPNSQWYDYQENGESVVRRGIDVSSFQGNINWSKVAAAGIDYAIIRLGIRGYGSGKLVMDSKFEDNIKGALANGIEVAVYFFSEAISEEEAIEEAEFAMAALEPYGIKCTLAIDVENVHDDASRTNGLSQAQWTDNCIAFCNRIMEEGYTPLIYGNMESYMLMLDIARLNDYPKWWAAYYDYFYYPYDFSVWQFTDKGVVDGIPEKVDLNISFGGWQSQVEN